MKRIPVTAVLLAMLPTMGGVQGQRSGVAMDESLARNLVWSVAAVVEREYFDEEVARRGGGALREAYGTGRYRDAETLEALAVALTRDLVDATEDKHFHVGVVPDGRAAAGPPAPDDDRAARVRRDNAGVRRVDVLPGNIGYLNLTFFYRLEEARDALAAAMQLLKNADALILDMRSNSGGSPGTVALLVSYLFDAPGLPLFEIVPRYGDTNVYQTMEPAVPERDGRRPVFVLTAPRTFSAGEGLAYLLQERRRAVVIGERTPGAANPGRAYPAGARLEVTVPNSQVRSVVAGGNWEGTGVTPDIEAPAGDALRIGQIEALRTLLERTPRGAWGETLQRHLEALEHPSGR